nr:hypothetical protein [Myxococcota bacterium]
DAGRRAGTLARAHQLARAASPALLASAWDAIGSPAAAFGALAAVAGMVAVAGGLASRRK